MTVAQQPSVTFLALDYPPQPTQGQWVHSLATALGHQGWQVNWVTAAAGQSPQGFPKGDTPQTLASKETLPERDLTSLAPTCQLIPIELDIDAQPCERSLKQAAQAILAQQTQRGLISPLFHSFDDVSAHLGQYFKACYGWRWLHTPPLGQSRMGTIQHTGAEPDQWLLWQGMATGTGDDEVNRQRQRHYGGFHRDPWLAIATHLHNIYRQHLAAYVGARHVEIPPVVTLPIAPEHLPSQDRELMLAHA
ncbi:hypothetical protein [Parathermosynechococcus lividus]